MGLRILGFKAARLPLTVLMLAIGGFLLFFGREKFIGVKNVLDLHRN